MKLTSTTRRVAVGETFIIELRENPTTGYLWSPVWPDGLLVLGNDYLSDQQLDPDPAVRAAPLVGGGGTRRFSLQATTAGRFELAFALRQPWSNGEAVELQRFEIVAA